MRRSSAVVVVPPPSLPGTGHTTRTPASPASCVLVAVISPGCAAIALFSLFKNSTRNATRVFFYNNSSGRRHCCPPKSAFRTGRPAGRVFLSKHALVPIPSGNVRQPPEVNRAKWYLPGWNSALRVIDMRRCTSWVAECLSLAVVLRTNGGRSHMVAQQERGTQRPFKFSRSGRAAPRTSTTCPAQRAAQKASYLRRIPRTPPRSAPRPAPKQAEETPGGASRNAELRMSSLKRHIFYYLSRLVG